MTKYITYNIIYRLLIYFNRINLISKQRSNRSIQIESKLTSIPLYPKFKKLKFSDKNIIEEYSSIFPCYSDFNFLNLFAWDIKDDTYYSTINNNLVLFTRDELMRNKIFCLLGNTEIENSLNVLLSTVETIRLVPEMIVNSIKHKDNYVIEEDKNNHDYIFSLEEMLKLSGANYESKRYSINKFKKKYREINIKLLNLSDKKITKQINSFIDENHINNHNIIKNHYLKYEVKAIKTTTKSDSFNLLTVGIYDADNLIGITITEKLKGDTALSPFLKANLSYKGISDYLTWATAKELVKCGYKYLNTEQDLGIAGLRSYKKSWRPFTKLKKYSISLKTK